MNRKRKRNYGYVILFLGLWFFWFQNVSASQMLFPFVADDWLSFEGHSFLELQQENERKNVNQTKEKKKDKENVKEAMAVPVKYDNVISAGDRQILYKNKYYVLSAHISYNLLTFYRQKSENIIYMKEDFFFSLKAHHLLPVYILWKAHG